MELHQTYKAHFIHDKGPGKGAKKTLVTLTIQPSPQALRFSQGRGARLVMSRKGSWEGYRRQVKPVVPFPPSFARARETSGYEAVTD